MAHMRILLPPKIRGKLLSFAHNIIVSKTEKNAKPAFNACTIPVYRMSWNTILLLIALWSRKEPFDSHKCNANEIATSTAEDETKKMRTPI